MNATSKIEKLSHLGLLYAELVALIISVGGLKAIVPSRL
jgi:hypothetical protein